MQGGPRQQVGFTLIPGSSIGLVLIHTEHYIAQGHSLSLMGPAHLSIANMQLF